MCCGIRATLKTLCIYCVMSSEHAFYTSLLLQFGCIVPLFLFSSYTPAGYTCKLVDKFSNILFISCYRCSSVSPDKQVGFEKVVQLITAPLCQFYYCQLYNNSILCYKLLIELTYQQCLRSCVEVISSCWTSLYIHSILLSHFASVIEWYFFLTHLSHLMVLNKVKFYPHFSLNVFINNLLLEFEDLRIKCNVGLIY